MIFQEKLDITCIAAETGKLSQAIAVHPHLKLESCAEQSRFSVLKLESYGEQSLFTRGLVDGAEKIYQKTTFQTVC